MWYNKVKVHYWQTQIIPHAVLTARYKHVITYYIEFCEKHILNHLYESALYQTLKGSKPSQRKALTGLDEGFKVNKSVYIAKSRQRLIIMELYIIWTVCIRVPSRCFSLIQSLQYRFNCQGYYTPFYKEKLLEKEQIKNVSRVGSSNTGNYNNSEHFI